jgi:hypothetical protein
MTCIITDVSRAALLIPSSVLAPAYEGTKLLNYFKHTLLHGP